MWTEGVSVRRPGDGFLTAYVETLGLRRLSYADVGMTRQADLPAGYRRTERSVAVTDWSRAVTAIRSWATHSQHWVELRPTVPRIAPGADVGVLARAAGLWWLMPTRVVYVVDTPDRYGFAYGTLEGHIEAGEELFVVEQSGTEARFRILAVSRESDALASLGRPAIERFQRKFVEGALDAVRKRSV